MRGFLTRRAAPAEFQRRLLFIGAVPVLSLSVQMGSQGRHGAQTLFPWGRGRMAWKWGRLVRTFVAPMAPLSAFPPRL